MHIFVHTVLKKSFLKKKYENKYQKTIKIMMKGYRGNWVIKVGQNTTD